MTMTAMPIRFASSALAVALLAAGALADACAQTQLAPPQARITDEVIAADLDAYQALQERLRALNAAGRPLRDYGMAKAQCWLDVSFHEYTRNDRSAFPQAALAESEKLVVLMEQGAHPLPTETPLVNDARYLRDDLWQRLRAVQAGPAASCAAQAAACGEVELVHAGNEFNQQQWRHAKPYIQMAEDLVNDAEAASRQCVASAAASSPVDAAAPLEPLVANVLFDFDRDAYGDIRTYSLESVDRALARLQSEGLVLRSVEVIGHADRMDGRGHAHNEALSARRAETVRALLVGRGIDNALISYAYRGDREPVQRCEGVKPRAALLECLLPNRRVEVRFVVARPRG